MGRTDDALSAYDAGFDELAVVLGLAHRDAQASYQLSRGRALADVGRWHEALPALQRAIELLQQQDIAGGTDLFESRVYLVQTQCGLGQRQQGVQALDEVRRELGDIEAREIRAALDEAQFLCDASIAPATALAALEHAAVLDARAPPGEALAVARREWRRATLLEQAGRVPDAAAARRSAEQRLRAVGLSPQALSSLQ
jgi:tetratricopeptide (TPR) repeat protein